MSITQLSSGAKMTRQGITKHLRQLEKARLIRWARRGRESVWELDQNRVEDARRYLVAISLQWDDALARLRSFVEK
jgi:hypothetical protein